MYIRLICVKKHLHEHALKNKKNYDLFRKLFKKIDLFRKIVKKKNVLPFQNMFV